MPQNDTLTAADPSHCPAGAVPRAVAGGPAQRPSARSLRIDALDAQLGSPRLPRREVNTREINTTGRALSDATRCPCQLAVIFADGRWALSFHPSTHDAAVAMEAWQHPVECWSLTLAADGGARR